MTAGSRRVLWTVSCAHAFVHVCELAIPALLLLVQREFGVGDFALGRVVTFYGLLFGGLALPAGWLVDRLGARPLLLVCVGGAAASVAAVGLAPGFGAFSVAACAMGAFLAIYHPAGTTWITTALPLSGGVFAAHGIAGNLGVACTAAVMGSLGAWLGWRAAMLCLGGVGALLVVALATLPASSAAGVPGKKDGGALARFAWLLAGMVFVGTVYRGLTTFLPKFFAVRYGAEGNAVAVGGFFTTAALLVGLVGMLAAARLTDRGARPDRVFLAAVLLQIPFLALLARPEGSWLLPSAMGVAFFHFMTQPVGNYMVARNTPPRLRGVGYGLYFFVSFGAGAVGAAFGGWVSEEWGLPRVFPALGAALLPAVVCASALVFFSGARGRSTRHP